MRNSLKAKIRYDQMERDTKKDIKLKKAKEIGDRKPYQVSMKTKDEREQNVGDKDEDMQTLL